MAEEETKEAESAEQPKEKKSSNLLMIIIIVVLILIIILGAVAAIFLIGGDEEEAEATTPAPQTKERTVQRDTPRPGSVLEGTRKLDEIGVLYPLDPFTVNLKSDSGRRYLKVAMSLELEGEELSMELDAKTAVLRDRIIRILSSKTLEEISSKKGKQKVTEQIMDTLNAMLNDGRIKGIYFTEFVIQ